MSKLFRQARRAVRALNRLVGEFIHPVIAKRAALHAYALTEQAPRRHVGLYGNCGGGDMVNE